MLAQHALVKYSTVLMLLVYLIIAHSLIEALIVQKRRACNLDFLHVLIICLYIEALHIVKVDSSSLGNPSLARMCTTRGSFERPRRATLQVPFAPLVYEQIQQACLVYDHQI